MKSSLAVTNKKIVIRLFLFQSFFCLFMMLSFYVSFGSSHAVDAFLGGMTACLPNLIFASLAFSVSGGSQLQKIMRLFYCGEALKLTLTIMMFTGIFLMKSVSFLAFFSTFISVQFMHGLVFFVSNNDN